MSNTIMESIADAAQERFGVVQAIIYKGHNEYFVACKRDAFPLPNRPYMTITASVQNHTGSGSAVAFYWGHYDMTLEEVNQAIEKHHQIAA